MRIYFGPIHKTQRHPNIGLYDLPPRKEKTYPEAQDFTNGLHAGSMRDYGIAIGFLTYVPSSVQTRVSETLYALNPKFVDAARLGIGGSGLLSTQSEEAPVPLSRVNPTEPALFKELYKETVIRNLKTVGYLGSMLFALAVTLLLSRAFSDS